MRRLLYTIIAIAGLASVAKAQPVPGTDENIPYLMTFGGDAKTEWGDDNFLQVIFFSVPVDYTQPVYIRVFDPDCGGQIDELNGQKGTVSFLRPQQPERVRNRAVNHRHDQIRGLQWFILCLHFLFWSP